MPQDTCTICKGSGFVLNDKSGLRTKCKCLIKEEVLEYLTPVLASATFMRSQKIEPFLNKNVLIQKVSQDKFKSLLKSFLLNSALKFSHLHTSPYDLLEASMSREKEYYQRLLNVDILALYFTSDPPNNSYDKIIMSALEKRFRNGKMTWVFAKSDINSYDFKNPYKDKLADYLNDNFSIVNLTQKSSF